MQSKCFYVKELHLLVRVDRVRLAVLEHETHALDRVPGEVALLARLQ